ncbi:acyl carrier protein [Neofamilia massiliensis]|uniref:acyl carrier protein n=1 Tax=Neofamilia massiliensis TaxID=1673724 RepID=UPI0006BB5B67|nr:acyl carrier protein [Neofamilia massiliensis]
MKEKVLEVIADQFGLDIDELNEDLSFKEDLEADSIQLMELVMTLEDEFDTEIDEEDIESIETVGDVIEYIENL